MTDENKNIMAEVKHTPGPWRTGGVYIDSDFGTVGHANFSADLSSGCPEANARLIAAAPDLFEAVREVLEALDVSRNGGEYPPFEAWETKARAALSKATTQQEGR